MFRRVLTLSLIAAASVWGSSSSHAQQPTPTTSWTGTIGDTLWVTAGNWSSGVPGTTAIAGFSSNANFEQTVSLGAVQRQIQTAVFSSTGGLLYVISGSG